MDKRVPHFNKPSTSEAIGVILLGLIALAFVGFCVVIFGTFLWIIWEPLPVIAGVLVVIWYVRK
uniref:Uncharacterized protein n=1 Tax=Pseudomonas phage HRDY3 TaxID=3236930 RepID=A0AB39CEK3_9VIRU